MSQKRFVVMSGTSGIGKSPLQAAIRKFYPGLVDGRVTLSTSRAPRDKEIHGKDFYFLPEAFIKSLRTSPDFVVASVRSDWQAIHIPQVAKLLEERELVFAEVFHTFGKELMDRAEQKGFESIRVFISPAPLSTSAPEVVGLVRQTLERRGTESEAKRKERAESAPHEMESVHSYTHILINGAGEDDVEQWGSLGTLNGRKGDRSIEVPEDLGLQARWLMDTFVGIVRGQVPRGTYAYADSVTPRGSV